MEVKADLWPVLFEQVYVKALDSASAKSARARTTGVHLIVLVHGFQGNSGDLRAMKNHLLMLHPEALFLCSTSNEKKTEDDIEDMGIRLANEVTEYIQEWCPGPTLGTISFIGHSLGGVIIRSALPYLSWLQDKMCTFATLSTPHLGYMYASNTLVNAGLWVLKKLRNSKCLEQLSMSDTSNGKESFLYKLSLGEGLNWFKHVLLVSSYQDRYIPIESARIELIQKAVKDEKYFWA